MLNRVYFGGDDLRIFNAKEENSFIFIEGSAAHFGTANLNGEIVDAASFEDFFVLYNDGKLTPALNYNHDPNMLIGGIDKIEIREDTLYVAAHVNKEIAFCRDTLIPMIMCGDCNSYSTEGFIDFNQIRENEDGTYYAGKFLLTAVAVAPVPADYKSEFTIKNNIERIKQERLAEAAAKRKIHLIV